MVNWTRCTVDRCAQHAFQTLISLLSLQHQENIDPCSAKMSNTKHIKERNVVAKQKTNETKIVHERGIHWTNVKHPHKHTQSALCSLFLLIFVNYGRRLQLTESSILMPILESKQSKTNYSSNTYKELDVNTRQMNQFVFIDFLHSIGMIWMVEANHAIKLLSNLGPQKKWRGDESLSSPYGNLFNFDCSRFHFILLTFSIFCCTIHCWRISIFRAIIVETIIFKIFIGNWIVHLLIFVFTYDHFID